VPRDTVVELTVSKGTEKLSSFQYTASRLLEIENCTQREVLQDDKVKCDVLGQVRVIEV